MPSPVEANFSQSEVDDKTAAGFLVAIDIPLLLALRLFMNCFFPILIAA